MCSDGKLKTTVVPRAPAPSPWCYGAGTSHERNRAAASALTCFFTVELPEIEPATLPGFLAAELPVRCISFPFSPAGHPRLWFGSSTASRVVNLFLGRYD